MPRRSLTTLLLLAIAVVAAVILPATPPGRDALLSRVAQVSGDAGYQVAWSASSGNPWRSLRFQDLRVKGPGVDARIGDVEVRWFLPALVTGDLPLWLTADQVDAELDLAAFPTADPDAAPGGGLRIRPDLRDVRLTGLNVVVDDVPFTLPDLEVSDLQVAGSGRTVRTSGRLATREGSARFQGTVDLTPFAMDLQVSEADVTIARRWWDGIEAGTVQARVQWLPDVGLRIDGTVAGGEIRTVGLAVRDIEGPVTMDGMLIQAVLSGVALDGPVAASARVDVANFRWSATLHGTPRLEAATAWGSPVELPATLVPQGEALVTAHAAGWAQVDVRASAQATGTLDGRPLTLATERVRFATGPGLVIEGHGAGLGGRFAVDAAERDGALTWRIGGESLSWGPFHHLDAELGYRMSADPVGTLVATGAMLGEAGAPLVMAEWADAGTPLLTRPHEREPPDAPVTFAVDGDILAGGLHLFSEGRAFGADLVGAASLQAGGLSGQLRLDGDLPGLGVGPTLQVDMDGPIRDLGLVATLDASEPVPLPLTAVRVRTLTPNGAPAAGIDLRGSASARLVGTDLRDVVGTFGPLTLQGDLPLVAPRSEAPATGTALPAGSGLSWSTEALHLSDSAGTGSVTLDSASGTLTPYQSGGTRLVGGVPLRGGQAGGVRLGALASELDVTLPFLPAPDSEPRLQARVDAPELQATLTGDGIDLHATGLTLTLPGGVPPGRLQGSAHWSFAADAGTPAAGDNAAPPLPLAQLRADLRLDAADASAHLTAAGGVASLHVQAQAGTPFAGTELTAPLTADANIDAFGTGTVELAFAGATLTGAFRELATPGGDADGELRSGDDAMLVAEWQRGDGSTISGRVLADGTVDLGAIAAAFGVQTDATLNVRDVSWTPGALTGAADATATHPIPVRAEWRDGTVTGTVDTPLGAVDLSGDAAPARPLTVTAEHPWGRVTLDRAGLDASGVIPQQDLLGAALPALAWRIQDGAVIAEAAHAAGSEALRAETHEGSVRLTVNLPLTVTQGQARLSGSADLGEEALDLSLTGSVPGAGGYELRLTGSLTAPEVRASADVAAASAALDLNLPLAGRIELPATVLDLNAFPTTAAGTPLTFTWSAAQRRIAVQVGRDASDDLQLQANGEGLTAVIGTQEFRATFDRFQAAPFLAPPLPATLADLRIGGALQGRFEDPLASLTGTLRADLPATEVDRAAEGAASDAADAWVELRFHDPADAEPFAVDAVGFGATAALRGTLAPRTDLILDAEHASTGVRADATIGGPDAPTGALTLSGDGRLELPAFGIGRAGLPAQTLAFRFDPSGAELTGKDRTAADRTGEEAEAETALAWRDGRLTGALTLAAHLQGEAHRLLLAADGALAAPNLRLRLEGPAAQAQAEGTLEDGFDLRATVMPASLGLPADLLRSDLAITGRAGFEGGAPSGELSLRTALSAPSVGGVTRELPVQAVATVTMESLTRITGTVELHGEGDDAAPLARAYARYQGGVLDATSDLDRWQLAPWLAPNGTVADLRTSGVATFQWQDGQPPRATLAGDLRATVAGAPARLDLDLHGDPSEPLGAAVVRFGAWQGSLSRSDAGDPLSVQASGPDLALAGEANAALAVLRLEGAYQRRPLDLRVVRENGGPWLAAARLGETRATVTARPQADGWRVGLELASSRTEVADAAANGDRSEASSDGTAFLAELVGTARAELAWADGTARLLQAEATLEEPTGLVLHASGPLWPDPDLSGTLQVGALPDPLAFRASSMAAERYRLAVDWQEATVSAEVAWPAPARESGPFGPELPLPFVQALSVSGQALVTGAVPAGDAAVRAGPDGLTWSEADGWRGSLHASHPLAVMEARGDGASLQLAGRLLPGAVPGVERAEAEWNAALTWADGSLSGGAQADVHAAGVEALADLEWSGSTLSPIVSGSLRTQGALHLDGTVQADRSGAHLTATGPHLTLDAQADPAGWRLAATADALPVDAWTAPLDDAVVGGNVTLQAGWGEALRGQARDLRFDATGVHLSGYADRNGGWTASAEVDVDLAVLAAGAASGRLVGPLRVALPDGVPVTRADLSGALRFERVRIGDAGVSGSLALSGSLPLPEVAADLRLTGPVEGRLRASWRGERVDVNMDLSASTPEGPVRLLARVVGRDGTLTADGGLSGALGTADLRADDGALRLVGHGELTGAELTIRPLPQGDRHAQLTLPLHVLAPPVTGVLTLRLDPSEAAWLQGRLDAPAVAGTRLPDLTLSTDGTRVRIDTPPGATADHGELQAELAFADLSWSLRGSGLSLPGGLRAAPDLRGTAATGRGSVAMRGPQEADAFVADLAFDAGELDLAVAGRAVGADVILQATRANGVWQGGGTLSGLQAPGGTVQAEVQVSGDALVPDVAMHGRWDGPLATRWTLNLSGADLRANAWLRSEPPGGDALVLDGEVWPQLDVRIAGVPATAADAPAPAEALRLHAPAYAGPDAWRAEGSTTLRVPGGRLTLAAPGTGTAPLQAVVTLDALPDLTVHWQAPDAAPVAAVQRLLRDGAVVTVGGSGSGSVAWLGGSDLSVNDLRVRHAYGEVRLTGALRGGALQAAGELRTTQAAADGADFAWPEELGPLRARLLGERPLPLRLTGDLAQPRLAFGGSGHSVRGEARFDSATGTASLSWHGPGVQAEVQLAPGAGVTGQATLSGLPLAAVDRTAEIDADLTFVAGSVHGNAGVRGVGSVRLQGSLPTDPWLPARYRSDEDVDATASAGQASLRVADLDLAAIPAVARFAPHLSGGVSLIAELRGTRLVGQASAPLLTIAGRDMPLSLEVVGDLATLTGAREDSPFGSGFTFAGRLHDSPFRGRVDDRELEALWTLERFPVHALVEAIAGPIDVESEATGVARVDLPWNDPAAGAVRVATEWVRLERAGAVSLGTFAATADRRGVVVNADFEGDGRWHAEGGLQDGVLDFTLQAVAADATPLLGLVPVLADLGAGAIGDLTIRAEGTLEAPQVVAQTGDLTLVLAGTRYRLSATEASLRGSQLRIDAVLTGEEPVGGRLTVAGDGELSLAPWGLRDAAVTLTGDVQVPLIGALTDVRGVIDADPQGLPRIEAEGSLGAPVRVSGTLWPLDVRASGQALPLRVPAFLLDQSVADVDLRVTAEDGVALSGRVHAREGRFAFGIRPPAAAPSPAAAGAPTRSQATGSRFTFQDLQISGRRLAFTEGFGSGEVELDLRLSGSAAEPRLAGRAVASRGTVRFSGRDFTLQEAVARFEPSRGVWPDLQIQAVTRLDKATVLASALPGTRFERPAGTTFEVLLSFDAEVVPTPGEAAPFRLDVDPTLHSDALVSQPEGAGLTAGARPLTEAELLSLVTLGRLDLSDQLGGGGVATGVARTALDSAVDLLVLSELQAALADALGLDLVQIRTSTLSSVLAGGGSDPFEVSLRLGGYLDEGLFATFELARYSDASEALTNTLALTYELGPLALDVSTRVGFRSAADPAPVPTISAGVRYRVTSFLAVEGAASLGTEEGDARFGVTIRW